MFDERFHENPLSCVKVFIFNRKNCKRQEFHSKKFRIDIASQQMLHRVDALIPVRGANQIILVP
jgi:hypothetical protein